MVFSPGRLYSQYFEAQVYINNTISFLKQTNNFIIIIIYLITMAEKETYDFVFKFILIGNGSSGKTSILSHFINGKRIHTPNNSRKENSNLNNRSRVLI